MFSSWPDIRYLEKLLRLLSLNHICLRYSLQLLEKKIKWVLSSLRKRTRQISSCECFAFKLISVTWRNFNFSANMCSSIFCSAHAIHLFVKKFNPPASKTRRPFAFKYLNTTSIILKIFVLFLFRSQFLFVVIC